MVKLEDRWNLFIQKIGRRIYRFAVFLFSLYVDVFLGFFVLLASVVWGWRKLYRWLRAFFRVARALSLGHLVTLGYFFKPKVTIQYPFQRSALAPYYRGRHYLVVEEDTGRIRCDGCTLCAKICPTSVIDVFGVGKGEERRPAKFTVNLIACIFCGLCVDICPEDAIKMVREVELASPWRNDAYEHEPYHPNVISLPQMMIFEGAIYPDGRPRNKNLEAAAKKKEAEAKAEGKVASHT